MGSLLGWGLHFLRQVCLTIMQMALPASPGGFCGVASHRRSPDCNHAYEMQKLIPKGCHGSEKIYMPQLLRNDDTLMEGKLGAEQLRAPINTLSRKARNNKWQKPSPILQTLFPKT